MNSDFWRQWQSLAAPFGWNPDAFASAGPATPGFAPFADAGERFAAALREFVGGARGAQPSPASATEAARAATEQFSNFLRDHFAGYFRPPGSSGPAGAASPAFSQGPALGPGREQILRAQRAFDAWSRLAQAQGGLQRMWSDTLRSAAAAFTSGLQAAPLEPLTAEAIDRLYDQWIDCAEEAYANTAHSEGFSAALSEQVNAAADWRRECAAGIDEWAKLWDLPTRSEVNTLTLRLRELEARLAAMRSRAASRDAASANAAAPASPRPARRAQAARAVDGVKPKRSKKSKPSAERRSAGSKRAR